MNTWSIDKAHSYVGFKVKHLMVSTAKGSFSDFSGTVTAADDTFENAEISFSAKTASITTGDEGRDGHLQSADFFDTAQFPELTFFSKSFIKSGDQFTVTGDLTIKGVTKEVKLDVDFEGVGSGMDGGKVAGFEFKGSINRQDFGLTWSAALETGGVVVSDTVVFDIQVELKSIA